MREDTLQVLHKSISIQKRSFGSRTVNALFHFEMIE